MANKYFTPKKFIPFTLVKADEVNTTEINTEAAFDLLPEPIIDGINIGFVENFKVLSSPSDINEVVRVADVMFNSYLFGLAYSSDGIYYHISLDPGPDQLVEGLVFYIKPEITNIGSAYLNLNNLGNIEILAYDARPLTGGELLYNTIICIGYINGKFQMISQSTNIAPEAPIDGKYYVRKNATWVALPDLTIPEASDLIFNDTNTCLKGDNVQIFCEALDEEVCKKVNRAGDRMTGHLYIEHNEPSLFLRSPNNLNTRIVRFTNYRDTDSFNIYTYNQYGEVTTWSIYDPETKIANFYQQVALHKEGTEHNHVVTKGYIDGSFVKKTGGEFTGNINFITVPTTNGHPTKDNDLATVAYVKSSTGAGNYVPVTGGVFTGHVSFSVIPSSSGVPTQPQDLVTKEYVDSNFGGEENYVPVTGGTFTGDVNFNANATFNNPPICYSSPSSSSHLVNKAYVDSVVGDPGNPPPATCCRDFDDYISITNADTSSAKIHMNAGGKNYLFNTDATGWAMGVSGRAFFGADDTEFAIFNRPRIKAGGYNTNTELIFDHSSVWASIGAYNSALVFEINGTFAFDVEYNSVNFAVPPTWWGGTPTQEGHLTNKSYVDNRYNTLENRINYLETKLREAGIAI